MLLWHGEVFGFCLEGGKGLGTSAGQVVSLIKIRVTIKLSICPVVSL